MIKKSSLSLVKIVTSTIATSAIMAVTVLAASCSPNSDSDSNNSEIIISDQSPNNQDVDSNITDNHNLYVNATCEGSNLKYQWYQNKNDNNGWTPIKGATSNQYQIPKSEINAINLETTWHFKAEIYTENNLENKVTSNVYSITIKPKKSELPLTPIEPITPAPKTDPDPDSTPPVTPTPKIDPTPPTNPEKPTPEPETKPPITSPTEEDKYNTEDVPSSLSFNYDEVNNSTPSYLPELDFLYKEEIIKRYTREPNKEYYETDLLTKYKDDGFKYPSYNYNYERDDNRYIKSNKIKFDIMKLVYAERTKLEDGTNVKFSDSRFITEQISKNSLKVHPAARTWYEQQITDDTQAIDKWFSIGTNKSGYIPLGLYAAPGEVITLEFDDDTFNLITSKNYRDLRIAINNNYWDNSDENNEARISNRYPFVQTSFSINPSNKTLQFGSPFGGNISIYIPYQLRDNSNSKTSIIKPISFKVKGAIESLNYIHGYTTKSDWESQINAVNSGKITAPNMSALYSWGSMNIPFTGDKKVANKKVETLVFPYDIFNKWNNFNFYSVYMSKRHWKLIDMKFCDDLWSGGLAFGGGYTLYAPISWAESSFLSGLAGFTITNSWGIMHEINHSYEQNDALFSKRGHGETNQVTIPALALISDTGINRSLDNINHEYTTTESSGWTYVSNSFSNIEKILKTNINEYPVYTAIMFAIGAKNYMDYVRYDTTYHPNTLSGWNGMKEIKSLSDYFQIDFWPAFESLHPKWNDNWPASYEAANDQNKKIINDLKQYKSIDFVGNLYAAGSYIYHNGNYIYTGDVNTPLEIPMYEENTFDFSKCINSVNKKFKWTNITVDEKSKNGVPLKVKDKSVYYDGTKNTSNNLTDEFNVTITPDDWEGKPDNYVPGYKWKIKIRNSPNKASFNLYQDVKNWDSNSNTLADEVKKYTLNKSFYANTFDSKMMPSITHTKNNVSRIRFSFIAPKNGTYDFYSFWNEKFTMYVDNLKVYSSQNKNTSNVPIYKINMKKNQIIDLDFFVFNSNSLSSFNISVKNNKEVIDLSKTLLSYGMSKISNDSENKYSYNDYLTNDNFKYKPRYANYLEFYQNNLSNNNNSNFVTPSKNLFTLSSKSVGNIEDLYRNWGYCEFWGSTPAQFVFDVNFVSPTKVGCIKFTNRTNNHWQARATKIKVTGINSAGKTLTLYDGQYGTWYGNRGDDETIISFNSVETLNSMNIELINEIDRAISLNTFTYSEDIYSPLNNNIPITNNYIAKTSGWSYINNTNNSFKIASEYGNNSLYTNTKYSAIDFNLKNARGFRLMGATTTSDVIFDVYINGKIHSRNVTIKGGSKNISNIELFKYLDVKEQNFIRVTIVNKSKGALIISYIQTYGGLGPVMTIPFDKLS